MVQLDFLEGKQAGSHCVARRFPFRIGRRQTSDLVLQEEGVWDDHLELRLQPAGVSVATLPGARVFLNGESVEEAPLASGDVLALGVVKMRFALSPAAQKRLLFRESLTWLILALLFASEILLMTWLVMGWEIPF